MKGATLSPIEIGVGLAIAVTIAIWGLFKYSRAETNAYEATKIEIRDAKTMIQVCIADNKAQDVLISALKERVGSCEKKIGELESEVEEYQEHLKRMRRTVTRLMNRTYPREINLNLGSRSPLPTPEVPPKVPPAKRLFTTKQKAGPKAGRAEETKELFKTIQKKLEDL